MPFERLTGQLQRRGHRHLVVLSGDEHWAKEQALALREQLRGDWLWVGQHAPVEPHSAPDALSGLLGREFLHAIFDARSGFDVSAFAALSGTLRAGSLLVLLLPPLSSWAERPDADSLRWSDSAEPIATPHFVHHFSRVIAADPDVVLWQQHSPLHLELLPHRTTGFRLTVNHSVNRLRS
jgi:tRNA(Met) cytidine acetyltransferase